MTDVIEVLTGSTATVEVTGDTNTVTDVDLAPTTVQVLQASSTNTVEVLGTGDTVVEVASNRGLPGPQGPAGPPGDPQLHIGPTPPSDTSLIWVKTPF